MANDATKPSKHETPASPATSTWSLSGCVEANGTPRRIPITSAPFLIGRQTGLSLSLPCLTVSKKHAEIVLDGDLLWVRDLGSTNGTYVNGRRVYTESTLAAGDLIQFGNVVFEVDADQVAVDTATISADATDRAMMMLHFDELMSNCAVVPFFQPIVTLEDRSILGYEVLGRSRFLGLKTPQAMFEAAAEFQVESQLSRMLRAAGIQAATEFGRSVELFVNTHPAELSEPGLIESLAEIREARPDQPLTLEVHEGTVTQPTKMRELQGRLSDMGIRIAYDDFGAGQSRLVELIEVPPDYLKFDLRLIKGIHAATAQRQELVAALVRMVAQMGIVPLAEGVEDEADHNACAQLGFTTGQGFLYGRPAPAQTWSNA